MRTLALATTNAAGTGLARVMGGARATIFATASTSHPSLKTATTMRPPTQSSESIAALMIRTARAPEPARIGSSAKVTVAALSEKTHKFLHYLLKHMHKYQFAL